MNKFIRELIPLVSIVWFALVSVGTALAGLEIESETGAFNWANLVIASVLFLIYHVALMTDAQFNRYNDLQILIEMIGEEFYVEKQVGDKVEKIGAIVVINHNKPQATEKYQVTIHVGGVGYAEQGDDPVKILRDYVFKKRQKAWARKILNE